MRTTWQLVSSVLIGVAFVVAVGWLFWWALKRSEDPLKLIFKWVFTAICVAILYFYIGPLAWSDAAIFAIPATAFMGLILAVIWRRTIASIIAKPFASLYDGGNEEPEPKPFYSVALAKRKRGDFTGARAVVREQLAKFPDDAEGQMLLAEIEAQDMHDLQAAEIVVNRFVNQPGHSAANIVYALSSMADWHLKYAQDRDSAQACFRRIIELLPDSDWALSAEQRLAHLGSTDQLLGAEARRRIQVPRIEGDPGLDGGSSIAKPVEEDGSVVAARYVKHLEQFPLDTEVREQLARLYAEHFKRLDLAMGQLEELIQHPNQPMRQVIKWLNMEADLQVNHGGTYEVARAALRRIIDLYPKAGAASVAQDRIELLTLEFKGKEKSQTVTLGSYEDDLGLKGRLPHQF